MTGPELRAATIRDLPAVLDLLKQASLPTEDLQESVGVQFWVAEDGDRVVGAIGLERFGTQGLLRSLVVSPEYRRRGLGVRLAKALEGYASAAGVQQLVLLTQTADRFFARLGYAAIDRAAAPEAVKASAEFGSLCPSCAHTMIKSLQATLRKVLFLCTGNSSRSILAEATFNHLAPPGWRAVSAGSCPAGRVHPRTLALLAREGIATDGYHSKSWDDLPEAPDLVVTVCASAAGETCPAYLGKALRTHWGVDDPARATGSDAEVEAAFENAYRTLRRRIEAFLRLPLADLVGDPVRFQAELDRIGTLA
jgi:arsenate reductase